MEVKSEVIIKFSGQLPTGTPAENKKVEISLTAKVALQSGKQCCSW